LPSFHTPFCCVVAFLCSLLERKLKFFLTRFTVKLRFPSPLVFQMNRTWFVYVFFFVLRSYIHPLCV